MYHDEAKEYEIFVGNCTKTIPDFLSAILPALRLGKQAYGATGNALDPDFIRPLFVQQTALSRYREIVDMQLKTITAEKFAARRAEIKRLHFRLQPIDDLDLSPRVKIRLKNAGIYTVNDLMKHSEADLLAIRFIGNSAVATIGRELAKGGLFLRVPAPKPERPDAAAPEKLDDSELVSKPYKLPESQPECADTARPKRRRAGGDGAVSAGF